MNRKCANVWIERGTVGILAVALVVALGCSGVDQTSGLAQPAMSPRYSGGGIGGTGNGPGQCLLEDTQEAAAISGGASDLNCASNEVAIGADVSEFSINGGSFVPFAPVGHIECRPEDVVRVVTSLTLTQKSSSPRLDVGIWINPSGFGDALTGDSCLQYSLTSDDQSIAADGDQCGDLGRGVTTVPLDTLTFVCPSSGQNAIPISSCVAWSSPGSDRQCPLSPPGGSLGLRLGTTPSAKSKCNCQTFEIPVSSTGVSVELTNPIGLGANAG